MLKRGDLFYGNFSFSKIVHSRADAENKVMSTFPTLSMKTYDDSEMDINMAISNTHKFNT